MTTLTPSAVPPLMGSTLSELVESIAVLQRMSASLAAMTAQLVDQAREWSEATEWAGQDVDSGPHAWGPQERARRCLVAELACALRMPERTIESLVAESGVLSKDLPGTMNALSEGRISWRHAQKVVEHATSLPAESRAAFEEAVLPDAERLSASRFGAVARRLRERVHPETIDERHRVARDERAVTISPATDGMCWLTAYLPAATALAVDDRLTRIAREQRTASIGRGDGDGRGDGRTETQRRADVLADLLLGRASGEEVGCAVAAQVLVTVPVMTLLGCSDEQAMLEGYGPIDLDTAAELAAGAPSWMRVLTHPETGAMLSLGRAKYRVTDDLRMFLRVRDETCRFPGCGRLARYADVDHTKDWADQSSTDHDNLAHLCRKHHRLKHQSRWRVGQLGEGVLRWVSPLGREYTSNPAHRLTG